MSRGKTYWCRKSFDACLARWNLCQDPRFQPKKICGSCLLGQSGLANTVRDWLKLTVVYWSFHHNTVWNTHFTLRKKVYSGPQVAKAIVCVLIVRREREGHYLKVTMCRHFLSDQTVLLFIDNGHLLWWIVDGEQKEKKHQQTIFLGELISFFIYFLIDLVNVYKSNPRSFSSLLCSPPSRGILPSV